MFPRIETTMRVSPSHHTREDQQLMQELKGWVLVYPIERAGWLVQINCPGQSIAERLADLRSVGFSDSFCEIIGLAFDEGCSFVRFDATVPQAVQLPVFDW